MELLKFEEYVTRNNHKGLAAAIGEFDGFHLAHQALLNKTLNISKEKDLKSAVITFDPHPDTVINPNIIPACIMSINDKAEYLEKRGFDYLIIIHFTKEVMKTSPADFVRRYLLDINVKDVIVGFDFSFGFKGTGKAENIKDLSKGILNVHIINEIKYQNDKMGSTLIRKLLHEGNVEEVTKILGRPFTVKGLVERGRGVGTTINLPTANISLKANYEELKIGVYGVIVTYHDKKYLGIANYGNNPSFNYKEKAILEVNILDFDENLYGNEITISFMLYLREEMVFPSKECFLSQINIDKEKTIKLLSKYL